MLLRPAGPLAVARAGRLHAARHLAATGTSSVSTRSPSCRVTRPHRRTPSMTLHPQPSSTRPARAASRAPRPRPRSSASPPASPRCASAAAGCSSSASAARPATPATRSTTSARSAASRPTRRPTTSRELTARTNDEGWDTVFSAWLRGLAARRRATRCWCSRSAAATREKNVSANLVARARARPKDVGARDLRHRRPRRRLHRPGGRRLRGHPAARSPTASRPHTEGLCAVVWHLLVQPPGAARSTATKWESRASELDVRWIVDRRRRRLHRQPLRRPAAGRRRPSTRSRSTTTSPPAGDWHLEPRSTTTRG